MKVYIIVSEDYDGIQEILIATLSRKKAIRSLKQLLHDGPPHSFFSMKECDLGSIACIGRLRAEWAKEAKERAERKARREEAPKAKEVEFIGFIPVDREGSDGTRGVPTA